MIKINIEFFFFIYIHKISLFIISCVMLYFYLFKCLINSSNIIGKVEFNNNYK